MNAQTIAQTDQLHAEVRDARCCDALAPCSTCQEKSAQVHAVRHAERVALLVAQARVRASV